METCIIEEKIRNKNDIILKMEMENKRVKCFVVREG
jgi:hypothetical protein